MGISEGNLVLLGLLASCAGSLAVTWLALKIIKLREDDRVERALQDINKSIVELREVK